jgi:prophage antirepressor-like protein
MAPDAARALGLSNPGTNIQRLDAGDKQQLNCGLRGQAPWFISEAGLYEFVLRSRKPEARDFARWVTKDVLPAIRKNGGYMTPAVAAQSPLPAAHVFANG